MAGPRAGARGGRGNNGRAGTRREGQEAHHFSSRKAGNGARRGDNQAENASRNQGRYSTLELIVLLDAIGMGMCTGKTIDVKRDFVTHMGPFLAESARVHGFDQTKLRELEDYHEKWLSMASRELSGSGKSSDLNFVAKEFLYASQQLLQRGKGKICFFREGTRYHIWHEGGAGKGAGFYTSFDFVSDPSTVVPCAEDIYAIPTAYQVRVVRHMTGNPTKEHPPSRSAQEELEQGPLEEDSDDNMISTPTSLHSSSSSLHLSNSPPHQGSVLETIFNNTLIDLQRTSPHRNPTLHGGSGFARPTGQRLSPILSLIVAVAHALTLRGLMMIGNGSFCDADDCVWCCFLVDMLCCRIANNNDGINSELVESALRPYGNSRWNLREQSHPLSFFTFMQQQSPNCRVRRQLERLLTSKFYGCGVDVHVLTSINLKNPDPDLHFDVQPMLDEFLESSEPCSICRQPATSRMDEGPEIMLLFQDNFRTTLPHMFENVVTVRVRNEYVDYRLQSLIVYEEDEQHFFTIARGSDGIIRMFDDAKVEDFSAQQVEEMRYIQIDTFVLKRMTRQEVKCPPKWVPSAAQADDSDSNDDNDDLCGICGKAGTLVMCDSCPSSFHLECISDDERERAEGDESLICKACRSFEEKKKAKKGRKRPSTSDTEYDGNKQDEQPQQASKSTAKTSRQSTLEQRRESPRRRARSPAARPSRSSPSRVARSSSSPGRRRTGSAGAARTLSFASASSSAPNPGTENLGTRRTVVSLAEKTANTSELIASTLAQQMQNHQQEREKRQLERENVSLRRQLKEAKASTSPKQGPPPYPYPYPMGWPQDNFCNYSHYPHSPYHPPPPPPYHPPPPPPYHPPPPPPYHPPPPPPYHPPPPPPPPAAAPPPFQYWNFAPAAPPPPPPHAPHAPPIVIDFFNRPPIPPPHAPPPIILDYWLQHPPAAAAAPLSSFFSQPPPVAPHYPHAELSLEPPMPAAAPSTNQEGAPSTSQEDVVSGNTA